MHGGAGKLIQQLEEELKTCKSGLLGLLHQCEECHVRIQKEMWERLEFIKDLEEQIKLLKEKK